VNVVFGPTDLNGDYLVLSRNGPDIFPDALLDFRVDVLYAVLRRLSKIK